MSWEPDGHEPECAICEKAYGPPAHDGPCKICPTCLECVLCDEDHYCRVCGGCWWECDHEERETMVERSVD